MFNSFKHRLPQISIFHYPPSPPSTKALGLLRAAVSSPYPASSPSSPPLEYNLEVIEAAPTSDQLKTILSYLPRATSPSMVLLSAHPASGATPEERPSTIEGIVELAERNPKALRWPIVVDWNGGKAAVGDMEGVKDILETLRKRRDGELEEEKVHQPKGWFV